MAKIKYPIYIPSKNRFNNCLTANFFMKDKVEFKLVIEPDEYEKYANVFGKSSLLLLPKSNQGLIYSRNFIRDHSIKNGFKRHWQFDDNISSIKRTHKGRRIDCNSDIAISTLEDFTDRYTNIALSGFNYYMFCVPKQVKIPYRMNCHVYSAFLLNNDMGYKWELPWNDDVDICLQIVTNKHCIIQFNAFCVQKIATMKTKGGCSDDYIKDGKETDIRLKGAQMLARKWPQYVKVVRKYDRWHFSIKNSWRDFNHPLIRRKDIDWEEIKKKKYSIKLVKKKDIVSPELQQFYKDSKNG